MYEYKAIVKRIIDGDTIVMDVDLGFNIIIKDERFRLVGINAPSIKGAEKEFGLLAKQRLEELCPIGSEKIIRVKKEREKFGRYLVIIMMPPESDVATVNKTLIYENHAVAFYDNVKDYDENNFF